MLKQGANKLRVEVGFAADSTCSAQMHSLVDLWFLSYIHFALGHFLKEAFGKGKVAFAFFETHYDVGKFCDKSFYYR